MRNHHIASFHINETVAIIIESFQSLKTLEAFDDITIKLHQEIPLENVILYTEDNALHGIRELRDTLIGMIKNKDELIPELRHENLGYVWNEILQKKRPKKPAIVLENRLIWAGSSYLLWSVPRKSSTWLYRIGQSVFLEVTPDYPWHYTDKTPLFSYEDFIKDYKSITKIQFSLEKAEEWLKHTFHLFTILQKNSPMEIE